MPGRRWPNRVYDDEHDLAHNHNHKHNDGSDHDGANEFHDDQHNNDDATDLWLPEHHQRASAEPLCETPAMPLR
jgi:hypothetical protein